MQRACSVKKKRQKKMPFIDSITTEKVSMSRAPPLGANVEGAPL